MIYRGFLATSLAWLQSLTVHGCTALWTINFNTSSFAICRSILYAIKRGSSCSIREWGRSNSQQYTTYGRVYLG
ncbi:uncharacterized protein GGS25DRAFT_496553 [Hypoxylon fragiforme]|uniref:uncharacterized protein n=1 Tax=Hypoxylon fragiforme TaxID=63214 RepID=UPI0020C7324C|nr:uncharacterized protein GGS25DRAFT_496553 [Hypoxylon fragiforme]KAI2607563.1 hypothetical protein GGS25DRAFT_496553 [Hypoxylon fragiforme]